MKRVTVGSVIADRDGRDLTVLYVGQQAEGAYWQGTYVDNGAPGVVFPEDLDS